MSWSRRPNSANDDADMNDNDPLADNLRFNRPRRAASSTEPLEADNDPSVFNQQTVVDNNFANRSQARRQRQMNSPFNTRQLTTWAASPDNSRKLLMVGAALLGFLLLIGLISYFSRGGDNPTTATDDEPAASEAAGLISPFESQAPAASQAPAFEFQTAPTVPNTDPAAQPPAAGTGGAFVVTGTGVEGLFLRPEPSTNGAPIATLPEGTRVEATGQTQNDGTREWRQVRTDQGEGWVASDFLQPTQ